MERKEATRQLAQTEQSLEQFSMQKKQFQGQLAEAEASLEALGTSDDAYKLIGNLMVKQPAEALRKELGERQETLRVRLGAIERQEEKLRAKAKELQPIVMQKEDEGK